MKKWWYVGWHTMAGAKNSDYFLVKDCIEFTDYDKAKAYLREQEAKNRNRYWVCVEAWARVSYKGQYNNNRAEG